jgi:hypothetical protein|uniref:Uncharacterized protein n=1 Tax=Podoviridae sp. ctiuS14 TaxID=2827620 RepID=A0A8S5LMQ0_9CAUD|nr:MAG TPA: hypothetical protein [Podoviridae sp. ctiuS14]
MTDEILMVSDEVLKSIADVWDKSDPLKGYLFLKNKTLNMNAETFLKYLKQFIEENGLQRDIPADFYKVLTEQETQKIEELNNDGEYYITRGPLKREISRRYRILDIPPSSFSSGEIVDNAIPTIYYNNDCFDLEIRKSLIFKESYNAFTLSRLFEALYGITRIPLRTQLSILGYKIPEIRKWLQRIQKKELCITFVGLGGMNLNVLENLLELCKDLDIRRPFEQLLIYENDVLEYHNTLRFSTTSLLMAKDRVMETKTKLAEFMPFPKAFLYHPKELNFLARTVHIANRRFTANDIPQRNIYFGAPDMETREAFFNSEASFFCAIHQNNTVSLWHQPKVDLSMQSETYGSIMLTEFFLNILDVTIQFIKALAENRGYEKDFCIYKNNFDAYEQLNNKGFIVPNYSVRSI